MRRGVAPRSTPSTTTRHQGLEAITSVPLPSSLVAAVEPVDGEAAADDGDAGEADVERPPADGSLARFGVGAAGREAALPAGDDSDEAARCERRRAGTALTSRSTVGLPSEGSFGS